MEAIVSRGYSDDKEAIGKRLRRIEGQVRGLQRMIDEDRYCIDILEQVSAATRALQSVALPYSTTTWPTAWPRRVRAAATRRPRSSVRRRRRSHAWCVREPGYGVKSPPGTRSDGRRTVARRCWLARRHRAQPARGVLHVLGDAVAADPGVHPFRRRAVLRQPRSHAGQDGRSPAGRGRPGVGLRHGLLLLLLRGHRHGEVDLREGRGLRRASACSCSPPPTL